MNSFATLTTEAQGTVLVLTGICNYLAMM